MPEVERLCRLRWLALTEPVAAEPAPDAIIMHRVTIDGAGIAAHGLMVDGVTRLSHVTTRGFTDAAIVNAGELEDIDTTHE